MTGEREPSQVRPMLASDLPLVLSWRNHFEVRRHMHTQHHIETSEHHAWFAKADADPNRHLLIFESAGVPCGFVQFSSEEPGQKTAEWGFYLAPGNRGGWQLGQAALSHAFEVLGFEEVKSNVKADNDRSLALHRRLGFVEDHSTPGVTLSDRAALVYFRLERLAWRKEAEGN